MLMYSINNFKEFKMKVFISWSGDKSNQLAEIMKKWIKQVIQSVEPFVSSQDLPKGTRWSADIAKELQDTNFGILCVTKDNFKEPWLLFEAGALSKTIDKSYVVPLLFDVEPSDLQDSPLLQFQASSFEKKDMKKLIQTLNNSNKEDVLDEATLDEAFDVWYPKLEDKLKEVSSIKSDIKVKKTENVTIKTEQIMEEILDLTRTNQKLLRNPDEDINKSLYEIKDKIDLLFKNRERTDIIKSKNQRYYFSMLDELLHRDSTDFDCYTTLSMILSLYKNDYPWIYENGKDLIVTLKSKKSFLIKDEAIDDYLKLINFTAHYFVRRMPEEFSKDNFVMLRELSIYIEKNKESLLSN